VFEHKVLLVLHDRYFLFSFYAKKLLQRFFSIAIQKLKNSNQSFFVIKFISTKHCFRKKCANHFTNKNIFTFIRKHFIKKFLKQTFHYTCRITPKRVTSLQWLAQHYSAKATQLPV